MDGFFSNGVFCFETGAATDVGCRRSINEDSLICRPEFGLWTVADGMGGHAAGDYASGMIVQELGSVGVAASEQDLQARYMERLVRANQAIRSHAVKLGGQTIGSTVVSLLVQGEDWFVVWSGDSRAYLMREGHLVQQSRDHTELQAMLDGGQLRPEDARSYPRKNVITRAIGVTAEPQCDIVSGKLRAGDLFVLCSDGLMEHMADREIAAIVRDYPPQAACNQLIRETLARGARDNVTVVVISCSPTMFDETTQPV
ncbi:protein phosphatase 2C domain-containing protein [Thioclava sp. FTW29]|uniref:Protein phosphatase 2C domain-containing protein n=1 Tax=Thioclava litoralis TaxID=3076557 RepID=A0ABZ1E413_9RHOB|nr:protein phosphatase 2C domain-containing protein [Thioclava sp. FTW29]